MTDPWKFISNMTYSIVSLFDLSDEILLTILKKLNWVDIFDLLFNVDERLDRLIIDSVIHASYIELLVTSSTGNIDSSAKTKLDRICSLILPQIHQHIKCLIIESSSMERILLAADYPELKVLGLLECGPDMITHHLNDESPLTHLLTQQITEIFIRTNKAIIEDSPTDFAADILAKILDICTNLTDLGFVSRTRFSKLPITACFSSTLVDLSIEVKTFDDCLYLLDGRLNNLRMLEIDIEDIDISLLNIDNTKVLPKLASFTLYSGNGTEECDDTIVPLLRRMTCLENLTLNLFIDDPSLSFIDGIDIRKEILVHMPQLRTFDCSIRSLLYIIDGIYLPSREDIQRTFIDETLYKINCSVDYWATKILLYHIYSYPFTGAKLSHITNNFSGGSFECVHRLSLIDQYPFEHNFFERIAQSFPFLKSLSIVNQQPQRTTENQTISIVRFHHLTYLDLLFVHIDYVKQFLFDNNTYLPRLIMLRINYQLLAEVTEDFTNDAARNNCSRLEKIYIDNNMVHPIRFYRYFPLMYSDNQTVSQSWWRRCLSYLLSFIPG